MSRLMRRLSLIFLVGLACGLPIGVAIGVLSWWRPDTTAATAANDDASQLFSKLKLHATGSHGASTFAMATGPIDEQVEGLFCLDFITGDLNCYVMQTNKSAAGVFKTNILGDLPPEKGKAPAYVLVTGGIEITAFAGNARPANTIIYVADSNTGKVAGYSLNWNKAMSATGAAQAGPLGKVFTTNARAVELRE